MINEATIRERAYALWEKDACPEGASKFYWHLARVQLEAQDQANSLNSPDVGTIFGSSAPYVGLSRRHES